MLLTGLHFLMDTGAETSVIPPSAATCKHPKDSLSLQAVNNTPIATYGTLLRTKHWTASQVSLIFIIADVKNPLLGDFLRH